MKFLDIIKGEYQKITKTKKAENVSKVNDITRSLLTITAVPN
jgi:hypothetical protein